MVRPNERKTKIRPHKLESFVLHITISESISILYLHRLQHGNHRSRCQVRISHCLNAMNLSHTEAVKTDIV